MVCLDSNPGLQYGRHRRNHVSRLGHIIVMTGWNNALWLVQISHVTIFKKSDCIRYFSYMLLCSGEIYWGVTSSLGLPISCRTDAKHELETRKGQMLISTVKKFHPTSPLSLLVLCSTPPPTHYSPIPLFLKFSQNNILIWLKRPAIATIT